MNFYTILTAIGKAKLANAQIMGQTVNLVEMALGDGNGSYYEPTESQEELVNEVWRENINQITNDSENPNWIVIETVVPTNQGGFTIREVGIFDDEGDMIAVGKYPETYKPQLSEGAGKDLYVRMILEVSNASAVTLKIDPATVLASRAYVDNHEAKPAPHSGHATKAEVEALNGYFEKVATWFVGEEPDIKLPMQVWVDTHEGVIKQRNLENTGWIVRAPISGSWGLPVGAMITMTGLLPNMPGFVQATGTILLRADYPLLWEFAQNSNNIVTDEEWFEEQRFYSYSYGDGETTFRIPRAFDFERGWDPSGNVPMGKWHQDQMQRITATVSPVVTASSVDASGAFSIVTLATGTYVGQEYGKQVKLQFDSANSPGARTSEATDGETWPCHGVLPKLIYTGEVW